jgi:hypothetical protein
LKTIAFTAAACCFWSGLAHATPTPWELLNENLDVVGTFLLDIDTQTTSDAHISGELSLYSIPSTFTSLNTNTYVGTYPVNNYLKFFSTEAGEVYREGYGNGEYTEIRVNDSAIDIGTVGELVVGGGLYDAFINEIYNYDEIYVYCGYYEEIYDEEGNYIGEGPCAYYYQDAYFNTEAGYWYDGFYLRSAAVVADVPIPSTAWLTAIGLAAYGASRKRRLTGRR